MTFLHAPLSRPPMGTGPTTDRSNHILLQALCRLGLRWNSFSTEYVYKDGGRPIGKPARAWLRDNRLMDFEDGGQQPVPTIEGWVEYLLLNRQFVHEWEPDTLRTRKIEDGKKCQAEAYGHGYPQLKNTARKDGFLMRAELVRCVQSRRYHAWRTDMANRLLSDKAWEFLSRYGTRFEEWDKAAQWFIGMPQMFLMSPGLKAVQILLPETGKQPVGLNFICKDNCTYAKEHDIWPTYFAQLGTYQWVQPDARGCQECQHEVLLDPLTMERIRVHHQTLGLSLREIDDRFPDDRCPPITQTVS